MTNAETTKKLNVLVTGTRGRVGNAFLPGLRRTFNITEFEVVLSAIRKTKPDCIVHLAANANQDAPAEEIQAPNYQGLQNVYVAAATCHVPKIIFASSMHTHSGHSGFPGKSPFEDRRKINPGDPYNPGNPYGESKVWGEDLAREYY